MRVATLELPGGMCNGDEDTIIAGVRELRGETGYVAGSPEAIGVPIFLDPTKNTNSVHLILCRNVKPIGTRELIPMALLAGSK